MYYVEPKVNRHGLVVGYSEVKKSSSKAKDFMKGKLEVSLGKIKYNDYLANPDNYYLSGCTLTELKSEQNTHEEN